MHIHSYQIHNVLNVYRKQLSRGPGGNGSQTPSPATANDRISISTDGQRQSIMDKVFSEIVERITQTGPENQFEAALADRMAQNPFPSKGPASDTPSDFKYTVIDEHNRKLTHTLTIQRFSPVNKECESKVENNNGKNPMAEME